MSSKAKRRMGVVTGVIVIMLVVVLAIVGGNSAARSVSVAEALESSEDVKLQVSGNVLEGSFDIQGDSISFSIYDPESDPSASAPLPVRYDGGVSAAFGNNVTAICTGKKDASGTLNCTEMVTKCPSKYENAEGALSIGGLLSYGTSVAGKPVKVIGTIEEGTLSSVDSGARFTLIDRDSGSALNVIFDGAIPDGAKEGTTVILTGSIRDDGTSFEATDLAMSR